MMPRLVLIAALAAGASVASAQMPASISKPIEQAKKAAAATNAQTNAVSQEPSVKPQAPAPAKAAPAKPAAGKPAAAAPAPANAAPAKAAPAKAAPAAGKPAAPAKGKAEGAPQDTNKITFEREVFTYVPGTTDPFSSPIDNGAIRPLIADLKLIGIIYDPSGRNSVAVLRDVSTQQQYRGKVGNKLGRAKVSAIKPDSVFLTIDEYGFNRVEKLGLNKPQNQQTKGKP